MGDKMGDKGSIATDEEIQAVLNSMPMPLVEETDVVVLFPPKQKPER